MLFQFTLTSPEVHFSLLPLHISTEQHRRTFFFAVCPGDYLSIRRRMKCDKQSEKCQATDTQLQRMQLCQWQIFSDLSPLACADGGLSLCRARFVFRPGSSSKECPGLKDSLTFTHSLFTDVVYVSVSGTFSLFIRLSAPSSVRCPSLCLLFSVSVSLYFQQVFFWVGRRLNQHFCCGWGFCSKVPRPASGDLLPHTNRAGDTHTPAHCSIVVHRCQTRSVLSPSHVCMLPLPLVSYSWISLKHCLNAWFAFFVHVPAFSSYKFSCYSLSKSLHQLLKERLLISSFWDLNVNATCKKCNLTSKSLHIVWNEMQ